MSRRKIDFEPTAKGQAFLKNSFLVNLDKKSTSALTPKLHDASNGGPFTVRTEIDGRLIRTNYYNDLQDARDYAAFVLTHYPLPTADVHLKICKFNGEVIEDFTSESDLTWFKLTASECRRLLPVRMINSDLHRGSYQNFNIDPAEYKPFTAKTY